MQFGNSLAVKWSNFRKIRKKWKNNKRNDFIKQPKLLKCDIFQVISPIKDWGSAFKVHGIICLKNFKKLEETYTTLFYLPNICEKRHETSFCTTVSRTGSHTLSLLDEH